MGDPAQQIEEQAPEATAEEARKTPPLAPARFRQAEYARNVFEVNCPSGTTLEDLIEQNYWQHVAHMLKQKDRIEVTDDTLTFYIELMVLAADRLWAHVAVVHEVDLLPFHGQDIPIDERHYKVEFAGAHHKYRVLYKGEMIKEGFATEALARRWASNHATALKR